MLRTIVIVAFLANFAFSAILVRNSDGSVDCPVDDTDRQDFEGDLQGLCVKTCGDNNCAWTGTAKDVDGLGIHSCRCETEEKKLTQNGDKVFNVRCEPEDDSDRSSADPEQICKDKCKEKGCVWTGKWTSVNGLGLTTCECIELKKPVLKRLSSATNETVNCEVEDDFESRSSEPKDVCVEVCKKEKLDWTGVCTKVNGLGVSTCECKELDSSKKNRASSPEEPCDPDKPALQRFGWNPLLVCIHTCRVNGKLWNGRWIWDMGHLKKCFCY